MEHNPLASGQSTLPPLNDDLGVHSQPQSDDELDMLERIRLNDPMLPASVRKLTEVGSCVRALKEIIHKELLLQMERLNQQLYHAFELYPSQILQRIESVNIQMENGQTYPAPSLKINDVRLKGSHPPDLADKVTSQNRIEKLIAYAEGVMDKAQTSNPTGDGKALFPMDIVGLITNCKKIFDFTISKIS